MDSRENLCRLHRSSIKTAEDLRRIDDTDTRLLSKLRRDGRATISDLADSLCLSCATVRARMERLVEIAGFALRSRPV
ncbi:MAG: AsnC family transcriptional regulator [Paracoccaceae bacterium]